MHDVQTVAEVLRNLVEVRFVGGVLVALVGHDDGLDAAIDLGVGSECVECCDRVGRTVERWDADGDARLSDRQRLAFEGLLAGIDGGVPARGVQAGFLLAGQVEPDPAAVLERSQGDGELGDSVAAFVGFDLGALDANAGAVVLGAV